MYKKITVISDLHGKNIWKEIISKEQDSDLFVFLGDYLDSFDITPIEQLNNLKEILNFKKENSKKVVLLLGNHDYHYLHYSSKKYSGFKATMLFDFHQILQKGLKENLFKIVHQENNILFSHAGITNEWCKNNNIEITKNFVNKINKKLLTDINCFEIYNSKGYGDEIWQSPLWIRPNSLMYDALKNYVQIVGHTCVESIEYCKSMYYPDALIYLTDVFDTSKSYLNIEINEKTRDKNYVTKTL